MKYTLTIATLIASACGDEPTAGHFEACESFGDCILLEDTCHPDYGICTEYCWAYDGEVGDCVPNDDCPEGCCEIGYATGRGYCLPSWSSYSQSDDFENEPEEQDECDSDYDCGYKKVCQSGSCISVECTNDAQCGSCERCGSDNRCYDCGSGPYGCYC